MNLEEAEFITMEKIMEEDREENNYNSPPRSPTFDHCNPNFSLSETPRRTSTCSIDTDNGSLSRFRLPDFSGSRLVNMILGSNKELSHSTDSVKDVHSNSVSAPFVLKSPCPPRRKSCTEPSPLAMSDDRATPDQPLLTPFQEDKTFDELSTLMPISPLSEPVIYQDKAPEYCAIKIPDLSVVEEESCSSSRGASPVNDPACVTLSLHSTSSSDEANTSFESLTTSSDSQSTGSFSDLLKNVV